MPALHLEWGPILLPEVLTKLETQSCPRLALTEKSQQEVSCGLTHLSFSVPPKLWESSSSTPLSSISIFL